MEEKTGKVTFVSRFEAKVEEEVLKYLEVVTPSKYQVFHDFLDVDTSIPLREFVAENKDSLVIFKQAGGLHTTGFNSLVMCAGQLACVVLTEGGELEAIYFRSTRENPIVQLFPTQSEGLGDNAFSTELFKSVVPDKREGAST